jgi:hypothetical protein
VGLSFISNSIDCPELTSDLRLFTNCREGDQRERRARPEDSLLFRPSIDGTPIDSKRISRQLWLRKHFAVRGDLYGWPATYQRSQNSRRPWNAIIRGELSPPNPTPSNPVGGEVG